MTYNPSVLDLLYLKLTPQGSLMTFRNAVYYTGSNAISNIWSKTSDSWTTWATFLTTTIVWDLLQTYSSILTNTINPIGAGTLIIGNTAVDTNIEISTRNGRNVVLHLGDGPDSTGDIDIGNGLGSTNTIQLLYATTGNGSSGVVNLGSATSTTNLYSPMTPIRTYPVIPMSQTNNTTTTYGTSGTIGFTIVRALIPTTRYPAVNNFVYAFSDLNLSLPVGIWILVGEITCTKTYGNINGTSFGLTAPTNPLTARPATFFGGNFVINFSSIAQNNQTLPFGGASMTITSVYTNNTGANQTVRLFQFQPSYGWETNVIGYFTATRKG
jgi:hypothetical protein